MERREDDYEHIILEMELKKALERDEFGNVIFTVEASNENLDIEEQRVLQNALMKTKDYFLKSGVVSKDHKHRTFHKDGSFDIHEEFVIGEPLGVFTEGTSTMVKGKLYAKNAHAQKFIDLLDQGSTRVKASVGGLVPRIKKTVDETGKKIGEVISVLWDDIALTITPVNPTVAPAVSMAKSLSSVEFVKALSVGYGTDSATFTGGRALAKEDVGHENLIKLNEKAVASLVGAMADGDVVGEDDAESFLMDYGISKSDAHDIVQAVCKKSNQFMEVFPMAKKAGEIWDEIKKNLAKSFGGSPSKNDDDPDDTASDDPTNDDDDDTEDATAIIKSLSDKVDSLEEVIEIMAKAQTTVLEKLEETGTMQKSLGQGILALMDRTEEVIASPAPRKGATTALEAALAKSIGNATAAAGGGSGGGLKPFTTKTFDITKDILNKAVSDGEISIQQCALYETHINKSMGKAAYVFPEDFVAFMKKHIN